MCPGCRRQWEQHYKLFLNPYRRIMWRIPPQQPREQLPWKQNHILTPMQQPSSQDHLRQRWVSYYFYFSCANLFFLHFIFNHFLVGIAKWRQSDRQHAKWQIYVNWFVCTKIGHLIMTIKLSHLTLMPQSERFYWFVD